MIVGIGSKVSHAFRSLVVGGFLDSSLPVSVIGFDQRHRRPFFEMVAEAFRESKPRRLDVIVPHLGMGEVWIWPQSLSVLFSFDKFSGRRAMVRWVANSDISEMIEWNLDIATGQPSEWKPEIEQLLGYTHEMWMRMSLSLFFPYTDDYQRVDEIIHTVRSSHSVGESAQTSFPVFVRTADQSTLAARMALTPISDTTIHVWMIVMFAAPQIAANTSSSIAAAGDSPRTSSIGDEEHEMFMAASEARTALHSITGFAQALEDTRGITDTMRKYTHGIRRATAQATLALDRSTYRLSHAGSGTKLDRTVRVDLLMHNLSRLLQGIGVERGIRIDTTITTNVKDRSFELQSQRNRLEQALMSVMTNAVQASPEGGMVTVLVETRPALTHEMELVFTIDDTGPGMTSAELEHAEHVWNSPQTPDSLQGGSHSGLRVCGFAIHELEGRASIMSGSKGTRVQFHIPARPTHPFSSDTELLPIIEVPSDVSSMGSHNSDSSSEELGIDILAGNSEEHFKDTVSLKPPTPPTKTITVVATTPAAAATPAPAAADYFTSPVIGKRRIAGIRLPAESSIPDFEDDERITTNLHPPSRSPPLRVRTPRIPTDEADARA